MLRKYPILLLILICGCTSKEQLLIGKWIKVEERYTDSNGKVSIEKVTRPETYIFEEGHKVKLAVNGELCKGVYKIGKEGKSDILYTSITSKKKAWVFDNYYRISFTDSAAMKRVSFTMVHPINKKIPVTGRDDIYEKIE